MGALKIQEREITEKEIEEIYKRSQQAISSLKKKLKSRPLTLTEKILFSHLSMFKNQSLEKNLERGNSFLQLKPDRVAMQDATAQMALLQFMLSGRKSSKVPATVHCDHLILAYQGIKKDLPMAFKENEEVFQFLSSAASHYGMGFWKPGSGIIHQVLLEKYAFPGGLMIGTDSHTPNAGGLGMLACGVGGADASDVMSGLSWEVKTPLIVGVHLKGELKGWASSKDVILKLCGIMTVKGGTNKVIEYFGEGTRSISATGKGTICNMGAELGATSSVFPFDSRMETYLKVTGREKWAQLACQYQKELLQADPEVYASPDQFYDEIIEINLSELEPHLVGPHSPDAARPLSQVKQEAKEAHWPLRLSAALIGSCTNSSYEDIGRANYVAEQALEKKLKMPQVFMVSPGSSQIKKTIERDGYMKTLTEIGGLVLANACGPCIGQWKRDDFKKGEPNTILNSFNRNFPGRNDGNHDTFSFIASPELVTAIGLSGRLDFNPETDELENSKGEKFKLKAPPSHLPELPLLGFVDDPEVYQAPKGQKVKVIFKKDSQRIQALTPFPVWKEKHFENLLLLCKTIGKCTTDHISPAGFWLRYRGHLENISDNLLLGAQNTFSPSRGKGQNLMTQEKEVELAKIAKDYKSKGRTWIIVGDENYGEGSSREHAAMSPRFLGGLAVIAKSFARIHETNLKKQGLLALTFSDPKDYDKINQESKIDLKGFETFAPNSVFTLRLYQFQDQGQRNIHYEDIPLKHSFNEEQVKWFKAGSALNFLRSNSKP